ncbi:MAG: RluA family pseudouridine synthase [Anaerolineae bacterium]|nr:RluA family pseudouridine synthase [Anaerolineae bacterium]
MEGTVRLTVTEPAGRVDRFVAERVSHLSRSQIKQLIMDGLVTVNGEVVKASHRLEQGDQVLLRTPEAEQVVLVPEPTPLSVVYEDQDLLVVDKPAGLVVHPAPGHRGGTLVNALLARYPDLPIDESKRPGIVHRLDKDTSGLIIVAKNEEARQKLQQQFKESRVGKIYLALVEGRVEPARGVIDAALGRDPRNRKRMAVIPRGGRQSRTEYRVLEQLGDRSLLEVRPLTGRTHQVRVHLAFIGHPVVGDRTYGYRRQRLEVTRQFLHAHRLRFLLPSSEQEIELVSELPADLAGVLAGLRGHRLISADEWEGKEPEG